jgi:hypothetical protein
MIIRKPRLDRPAVPTIIDESPSFDLIVVGEHAPRQRLCWEDREVVEEAWAGVNWSGVHVRTLLAG